MGKLLPCDVAENITMTLHLEDYRSCLIHGSAVPTGYELTELTLECNFVELSAESEAALQGSLGSSPAVFDYEAVNSTSFTKQTGDLTQPEHRQPRVVAEQDAHDHAQFCLAAVGNAAISHQPFSCQHQ